MSTRLSHRGYSITELLFVVAVIGIVSAIAVPTFSDVHERRLLTATSEVETALRFARNEAMRTGIPHGVRKVSGQNSISVFRMDIQQDPPVEIHDIRYPLDRSQLYQVELGNYHNTKATTITADFRIYGAAAMHEAISFNSRGEPIDGVTAKPMVLTGFFRLDNSGRKATVSVSRLAGRVTSGQPPVIPAEIVIVPL